MWNKLKKGTKKFMKTMDQLKYNKRAVYWLLAINLALAISSTVVDIPWLIRVPTYVVIFAPICSLYPWLNFIWFTLWIFKKKIPGWYTSFLFMGLVSYGIMAWIYYPLYMSWNGVNFHDIGSIFWVAAYCSQSLIIASELKKLRWYQFLPVIGYFFFKDYSDRYLGTFLDILLDTYPEYLKLLFFTSVLTLHTITAGLLIYLPFRKESMVKSGKLNQVPQGASIGLTVEKFS